EARRIRSGSYGGDSRESPAKLDEQGLERQAVRELELLEVPPRLADQLGRALGALEPLERAVLEELVGPIGVDESPLGTGRRPARSSRPPATRAIETACSSESSGARSRTSFNTARSESRRNGTCWQRERIVSGSEPSSSATSTITA